LIIRLLQKQIPKYWDIIKYATSKTEGLLENNQKTYFTMLLYDLLNGNAQCFLGAKPETKHIHTVMVTKIKLNKITGIKYLEIVSLYSFESQSLEARKKQLDFLRDFAKQEDVSEVIFETANKRVFELAEMYGAREMYRVFSYRMGDV